MIQKELDFRLEQSVTGPALVEPQRLSRVEWRTGGVPMTKKTKIKAQKKAEEDANLDEALVETFPASDPLSMTQPRTGADVPQRRPRRHPKGEVPPRKITNHR